MGTLEVGLNVLFYYAMFRYGAHRLMCVDVWLIESGSIWRYGLVGIGVSLWVWALRLILAAWKSVFC